MTEITNVLAVPATGACHAADLAALHDEPIPVADQYTTPAAAPGFHAVRQVAEVVSVGLILGDPSAQPPAGRAAAWGDCVTVGHPAQCGRDPVFRAADGLSTIRRTLVPVLLGRPITTFREMAAEIDALTEETRVPTPQKPSSQEEEPPAPPDLGDAVRGEKLSRRDLLSAPLRALRPEGSAGRRADRQRRSRPEYVTARRPIHSAVRYGVSQALLKAVALSRGLTMAEVILDEWDLTEPHRSVPIHAQSGRERRENADRMILRRLDSLPDALVEDVPLHLGREGEQLIRYLRWLTDRIDELAGPDYRPTIHLDLHGALGRIYENNLGQILGYLYRLESCVQPSTLRLESPVIMETRAAQIDAMRTLREYVSFQKMAVEIVADEWVSTVEDIQAFIDAEAADMIHVKMPQLGSISNSVEAVLACREAGVAALLGGSCTETDLAARAAAHVALATQPDLLLARPGPDVDTAVSSVQNEMTRTLALIQARGT